VFCAWPIPFFDFGFGVVSIVRGNKYHGLFATESEWGFAVENLRDEQDIAWGRPKLRYNEKYPTSSFTSMMINHPLKDELYDLLLYLQRQIKVVTSAAAPYVRDMEVWSHERTSRRSNIEDADGV
jgi:hypothetical protein